MALRAPRIAKEAAFCGLPASNVSRKVAGADESLSSVTDAENRCLAIDGPEDDDHAGERSAGSRAAKAQPALHEPHLDAGTWLMQLVIPDVFMPPTCVCA